MPEITAFFSYKEPPKMSVKDSHAYLLSEETEGYATKSANIETVLSRVVIYKKLIYNLIIYVLNKLKSL